MTKKLAEIWQKTPQEDRKTYYGKQTVNELSSSVSKLCYCITEMYEKDKARYAQEMKDFESKSNMTMSSAMEEAPSTSPSVQLHSKDMAHPDDNLG